MHQCCEEDVDVQDAAEPHRCAVFSAPVQAFQRHSRSEWKTNRFARNCPDFIDLSQGRVAAAIAATWLVQTENNTVMLAWEFLGAPLGRIPELAYPLEPAGDGNPVCLSALCPAISHQRRELSFGRLFAPSCPGREVRVRAKLATRGNAFTISHRLASKRGQLLISREVASDRYDSCELQSLQPEASTFFFVCGET